MKLGQLHSEKTALSTSKLLTLYSPSKTGNRDVITSICGECKDGGMLLHKYSELLDGCDTVVKVLFTLGVMNFN